MHESPSIKTVAVIPSAGKGRRLGFRKKPYLMLNGKPVLAHTLSAFERCALVQAVVVVAAPSDLEYCREKVVERYGFKKVIAVVEGGRERQDSVRNAVDTLGDEWEIVVVHDGARPLVVPSLIERAVNAARECGGAITAVRPKDTIKEVDGSGRVKRTIARETLVSVQTPQAFRLDLLRRAYREAARQGFTGTDDSTLVERLGERVAVVVGSYENIKITTEEDIAVAELILRSREKGGAEGP